jgi:TolB-like protein/predicted Ser/Thr protein kinase
MIGQALGHYRVEAQLGAGGMGVVYRAHDTTLGRTVAIKLVGDRFASEPTARERLKREARTASSLNHPHICTIHEVGESEGHVYVVMEYVKGQLLSAVREPRPPETIVRYGIQIADALAHAHEQGIVHRDLKTSNVMITPEGRAKVLDFGLAKRLPTAELAEESTRSSDSLSEPGQIAGTLHYLAPEVLRGHPADARADVWALGVLLYELAAGSVPFKGNTRFEVTHAILGDTPAPLPGSVPAPLRAVIQRCLAKDAAERYRHAGEVHVALETVQSGTFKAEEPPRAPRPRGRWLAAGAAAIVILAAGLLATRLMPGSGHDIESVAVLPFANVGANPEVDYLGDGITENVIGSLSRLPDLKVIAFGSVLRYKGRPVDPQDVVKDLAVGATVMGRVAQHGDTLTITAELIDTRDKSRLWGNQYDVKPAEVQTVQQDISRQLADRLRHRLSGGEMARVTRRYTEDAEAYDSYLKGRYYYGKDTFEGYQKALEFYRRAIARDPRYAPAHAGIALVYISLNAWGYVSPKEAFQETETAAREAQKLDDSLAEVHWALAVLKDTRDWDWAGAEKEWQRALALDPQVHFIHHYYATLHLRTLSRWDEAFAQMKEALVLDPLGLETNNGLAYTYYWARRYDDAIQQARKMLEIDPNYSGAHDLLADVYERKGLFPEAIAARQQLFRVHGLTEDADGLGQDFKTLGFEAVMRQQHESTLDQLKETAKTEYVAPLSFAVAYAKLGDKDQALGWLEKAVDEHSASVIYIATDPEYDNVRSDRRFAALVQRIGLPPVRNP